jgi:hypothetical protein
MFVWGRFKRSAKTREIQFDLSIEEGWDLFLSQNRLCAMSGVPLKFAPSQKKGSQRTASLDRMDSSKGYAISNVQWVHKTLNLMKRDLPLDEFLRWCELVASRKERLPAGKAG